MCERKNNSQILQQDIPYVGNSNKFPNDKLHGKYTCDKNFIILKPPEGQTFEDGTVISRIQIKTEPSKPEYDSDESSDESTAGLFD